MKKQKSQPTQDPRTASDMAPGRRSLLLSRETLRILSSADLHEVVGGAALSTLCSKSCNQQNCASQ